LLDCLFISGQLGEYAAELVASGRIVWKSGDAAITRRQRLAPVVDVEVERSLHAITFAGSNISGLQDGDGFQPGGVALSIMTLADQQVGQLFMGGGEIRILGDGLTK